MLLKSLVTQPSQCTSAVENQQKNALYLQHLPIFAQLQTYHRTLKQVMAVVFQFITRHACFNDVA
jgi:hypothetical protein